VKKVIYISSILFGLTGLIVFYYLFQFNPEIKPNSLFGNLFVNKYFYTGENHKLIIFDINSDARENVFINFISDSDDLNNDADVDNNDDDIIFTPQNFKTLFTFQKKYIYNKSEKINFTDENLRWSIGGYK